jgi:hypothetical protein
MNNFYRLLEYRIRASQLLKQLRSADPEKYLPAAKRFRQLHSYADRSPEEIWIDRSAIKLKHAYMLLALEQGMSSWTEFKRRIISEDCFYIKGCGGFTNAWYKSYETARTHLDQAGGYLLTYRSHYFICTSTYIEALGLQHLEEDWRLIGYDWVKPKDQDAWNRIFMEAQQNYLRALGSGEGL